MLTEGLYYFDLKVGRKCFTAVPQNGKSRDILQLTYVGSRKNTSNGITYHTFITEEGKEMILPCVPPIFKTKKDALADTNPIQIVSKNLCDIMNKSKYGRMQPKTDARAKSGAVYENVTVYKWNKSAGRAILCQEDACHFRYWLDDKGFHTEPCVKEIRVYATKQLCTADNKVKVK